MLRNFFKTALRNMLKYKAYSLINFIGLTAGLGLALLIITYVRSELSYDRFHENADRLYRIAYTAPNGMKLASSPPPIAPLMADFFPEVEEAARVYRRNVSVSHPEGQEGESFEEPSVLFADSALMKMFSITFVAGSNKRALVNPFTLLISEETAKKYFGNRNPLGESLTFGGEHQFKITGVVKDFPENSHLRFHMIAPYDNMFDLENDETAQRMRNNLATNFVISHSYTYVLLKPGASPAGVDQNMPAFLKKYCPLDRMVGQIFTLFPLTDIHLKSELLAEPSSTNSVTNILVFMAIGLLTLLIACINYVNLSTAQAFTRIREIGIRKILGSGRSQLMGQFLAESFLFCMVAFAMSYLVFYTALPLLNQFTNKQMLFAEAVDTKLIVTSMLLLLIVTLLAGGYPAWFITTFNSVASLKGTGSNLDGSQYLRKSLVVFQLMVACMLLSGSLMLVKQLNFIREQPLGFEKEHVITIPLASQNLNSIFKRADSTYRSRLQTFRERTEAESGVQNTSASSGTPGLGAIYRGTIPEGFTREDNLFIADLAVDYDFIPAYGIQLKAGRMFSRDFVSDAKDAFIVNETAVKEFRWGSAQEALGKTIDREGKKGKVIGVVNDFNMAALTTPIGSVLMEIDPNQWNTLSVRFTNSNVPEAIEKIRKEWNGVFPEKSFEFSFLDEQLNQQYDDFQNFGKIIESFTLIAILISCLGVYGLVLFVVQRKVKEIGVRKVLGASVGGILRLIYREFMWLLILGFVLAVPVSYYFIQKWLTNFTFHTQIDVLTYVVSFIILATVVTLTISYHALRASTANPVLSLRSE
jgi:putative ABC transport system permease protein